MMERLLPNTDLCRHSVTMRRKPSCPRLSARSLQRKSLTSGSGSRTASTGAWHFSPNWIDVTARFVFRELPHPTRSSSAVLLGEAANFYCIFRTDTTDPLSTNIHVPIQHRFWYVYYHVLVNVGWGCMEESSCDPCSDWQVPRERSQGRYFQRQAASWVDKGIHRWYYVLHTRTVNLEYPDVMLLAPAVLKFV